MATKVPKKVAADAGSQQGKVDFTKKFTNGHKFFGAQESRAHKELLHTEQQKRDNFVNLKDKLKVPRNPLNGDFTPRDYKGDRVTNPNNFLAIEGGVLLFDPNHEEERANAPKISSKHTLLSTTTKIGIQHGKYDIMGLSPENDPTAPACSVSQYDTVRISASEKNAEAEERRRINECVLRHKAKRETQAIDRELAVLKKKQDEKEQQRNYLQSTYKL